MAKEVQVLTWCDLHSEKVTATREVTINANNRAYVLDLCDEDAEKIEDQMREWASKGTLVPLGPGRPKQDGSTTCLICNKEHPTRSALGHHVRKRHDMGIREMEGQSTTP
jgi:hypothetical protein